MSTVGGALVLAPALGPVIGGLLISHASWRWLFLVNGPVGVAAAVGWRWMPRSAPRTRSRFDAIGFVLAGVALPAVTLAISRIGPVKDLTAVTFWIPLLGGLVVLAFFIRRCLHAAEPLLNMRLFGGRAFALGAAASFLAGAIQFGALVIWALYFQLERGYGVVATGLAMAGFALGAAALPIAGRFTDRLGGGPVTMVGALVTTAALLPMALLPATISLATAEACLFVLGVGNAFSIIPASTAVYVSVTPAAVPDAVTIINICLRLGGAIGSALLVAILSDGQGGTAAAAHFHAAFWSLAGIAVLLVASAGALAWPARAPAATAAVR
jgi:MFS family permease